MSRLLQELENCGALVWQGENGARIYRWDRFKEFAQIWLAMGGWAWYVGERPARCVEDIQSHIEYAISRVVHLTDQDVQAAPWIGEMLDTGYVVGDKIKDRKWDVAKEKHLGMDDIQWDS